MRIVIVDDHPLFRRGVRQLLDLEPQFTCVGEASSGDEALELAAHAKPDLILLDMQMAGLDGLATLRKLREAGTSSRVIMLTVSDHDEDLVAALRLGADGYLLKDMEPEELLERLRDAAGGRTVVSPRLGDALASSVAGHRRREADAETLTSREREVLAALGRGLSNKMIARQFDISEGTAKVHVKNVMRKLGLHSRTEAAIWAINHDMA
ncbi:MAG TPA: two-component system response regulator NarL [Gammaproteobacteria bacterium]|nr:two-component system response regulator NarL [Gammaproteobacteria bacterium]